MSHPFDLTGKTALVTGASRGLGWAMAEALARAGAHVVLNGRHQGPLDERATELQDQGLAATTKALDVTDESAAAAVAEVAAERGRLDILINNAGIQHREALLEIAYEDWKRIIDTHLNAAFVLSQAAARIMVEQKHGRIINTASVLGPQARPTVPAYTAAKGGLAALTRALAAELGGSGITCNAIAPGYIATELTEALAQDTAFDSYLKSRTPAGRWGRPEEIAAAAVFLASDAASYVNGHVLFVDGGLSIAV